MIWMSLHLCGANGKRHPRDQNDLFRNEQQRDFAENQYKIGIDESVINGPGQAGNPTIFEGLPCPKSILKIKN